MNHNRLITKRMIPTKDYIIYKPSGDILTIFKKDKPVWVDLYDGKTWSAFRKMVLGRDNHKCIKCGKDRHLHCHHIIKVNDNPNLAYDIDNCITLCKRCHFHQHWDNPKDRKLIINSILRKTEKKMKMMTELKKEKNQHEQRT